MKDKLHETKQLLLWFFSMATAIEQSTADGKFNVLDLGKFFSTFHLIGPAFDNVSEIGNELKFLSLEDKVDLTKFIQKELDLENDKIETIVETSLESLIHLVATVQLIRRNA